MKITNLYRKTIEFYETYGFNYKDSDFDDEQKINYMNE